MSDFGRRFDPSELRDGDLATNGEVAAAELLVVARELEALARSESAAPSVDFEERVMAVIATEPPPRPVATGGVLGLVGMVRDAWRLTWTGGRPLAVRAQALALVLLAAVAVGSLGSLAAVGVGALLTPETPPPSVAPSPSPSPSPSVAPSPSASASPSPSLTPTVSPTPSAEATETVEPTETAEATGDDSSGPGSGGTARPTGDSSRPGSGSGDSSGSGSGPGSGSGSDDSSGSGSGG